MNRNIIIEPEVREWILSRGHVKARHVSRQFGMNGHKAKDILMTLEAEGKLIRTQETMKRILYEVVK